MKLALFVEGETEKYLREFLKPWLDPKLGQSIDISVVNLNGVGNYLKDFDERARRDLRKGHLCGVVGLIDFYGSGLRYPHETVEKNYAWAKRELEQRVGESRFRQHFAVHETEAWLLSDPQIFPTGIAGHLPKQPNPETINLQHPPSKRLKDLYRTKLNRTYEKPLDGSTLFRKLDPEVAYSRCPHLQLLLDDMLSLAKDAAVVG